MFILYFLNASDLMLRVASQIYDGSNEYSVEVYQRALEGLSEESLNKLEAITRNDKKSSRMLSFILKNGLSSECWPGHPPILEKEREWLISSAFEFLGDTEGMENNDVANALCIASNGVATIRFKAKEAGKDPEYREILKTELFKLAKEFGKDCKTVERAMILDTLAVADILSKEKLLKDIRMAVQNLETLKDKISSVDNGINILILTLQDIDDDAREKSISQAFEEMQVSERTDLTSVLFANRIGAIGRKNSR